MTLPQPRPTVAGPSERPGRHERPAWRVRGEPLAYLLLALALALPVLLPGWGQPSVDTSPRLYFQPGRTLTGAFSTWSPAPSLGQQSYDVGIAPVAGAVWAIQTVTGSVWLTTRLWRLLLLLVAAAGAARLFHRLGGPGGGAVGRVAAAAVYAINPYVLVEGSTNPILLPYALLPWLLLALAASVRAPRAWRSPAAFAAVFFAMSGVNAGVVPLIMLLAVPCYLAYARLVEGAAWRVLAAATARCALLALAVSLYWLVPSLLASGVGASVAAFTESPQAVASTSSWTESLRLLGFWLLYGRSGPHPWMPSFVAFLTNPLVVTASFALPLAAVLAAWRSRARLRAFAAILLAVGVTAMVGSFPPDRPGPLGRLLAWSFRHVPGAIAFRTTNKAGALAALAIALLVAVGAVEAARWLAGQPRWRRWAATLAALAVLAVAVLPAWSGAASPNRVALPAYWRQAARDLDASARGSRVLLLPGEANAVYRWGDLGAEDVGQSLFSRGTAVRMAPIAGASLAQANYLAALTVPLQQQWAPGAVATMARYLGAGDVLLRNDMAWERSGGTHPSTLSARLDREPGLLLAGSYGRAGEHTVRPPEDRRVPEYGEPPRGDDLDAEVSPLRRYLVEQPQAVLRAEPADGSVLVDGDNFAVPTLARAGLLRQRPPFRLLGSMSAAELETALGDGARIVLTDSNRRRVWTTSRVGASFSPTMRAEDPMPAGQPSLSLFGPDAQSVVRLQGAASISATGPVGSIFTKHPGGKPAFAFDGDPGTAWTTGDFGSAVGRSITVTLDRPRVLSQVTLRPAKTEPMQVAAAVVHVGGRAVPVALPDDLDRSPQVTLRFPPAVARTVRVEITAVRGSAGDNPVGFAEIAVPGVRASETVRLPRRFRQLVGQLGAAGRALLARSPLDVVLQRQGDLQRPFLDEERVIDREFWLPDDRDFALSGHLARGPDLPDQAIDRLAGGMPPGVAASSSSRWFGNADARASQAIDGDPKTAWAPATNRPGEWLELRFPRRRVDHVTVRQLQPDGAVGPGLGYATDVELSLDGRPPVHVRLQAGTNRVAVPPRAAGRLRLTVRGVGGFGEQVRVSELEVGGVRGPRTGKASRLAGCVPVATLDGRPVRARVDGTLGDLGALPVAACERRPLPLAAGTHRLRSLPGWRVEDLRLASPGTGPPAGTRRPPPPPTGRVWSTSRTAVTVHTAAAAGPWYLVLGQGFDPRWSATMDGRPLGPPVLVDGYSVGWRVDAPGPHRFTITYGPQRVGVAAGLASLAALVVVLMLLVGRSRRATGAGRPELGSPPATGP
jgi:arabinofuranan 3-O-arabinosyltransferase